MNRFYTDFLAPSGSYFLGAGDVFGIMGGYFSYNRSANEQAADARAIRQDFAMIGQDILDVVAEIEAQKTRSQLKLPLAS